MSIDQDRRKVRTRGGAVGMVMNDLGKYVSIRVRGNPYYPIVKLADLEDITEEEFVREFGRYK